MIFDILLMIVVEKKECFSGNHWAWKKSSINLLFMFISSPSAFIYAILLLVPSPCLLSIYKHKKLLLPFNDERRLIGVLGQVHLTSFIIKNLQRLVTRENQSFFSQWLLFYAKKIEEFYGQKELIFFLENWLKYGTKIMKPMTYLV